MNLIATIPVRNESWVIGLSARVALSWCDEIIVLNHASTDATVELLADLQCEYPGRVSLISVPELQWSEMEHRQMMLERARQRGASHIAIVDADEILTGNLDDGESGHCCVKGMIEALRPGAILHLPGYNLRGGLRRYHANGIWGADGMPTTAGGRWFSTAFCNDPRLGWAGDRFHHREPCGMTLQPYRPIQKGEGGVMHLWGASERRLKARHALYKLTERLRWAQKPIAEIDRMYSWAIHGQPGHPSFGTPATWAYNEVPAAWWASYSQWMKYLDLEAEPWQEKAARETWAANPQAFAGLDLFGVI